MEDAYDASSFLFLLIIVVLLASCTPETYTPIPRNKSVVGVVNIKEQSLSFVDYNTKKTMATWKMKNPVTKAILLPDGDTVMLFGQDMDEMMMYTLSTGKEKKRWRVNKGVTDVLVTKHELLVVNEKDGTVSVMTFDGKVKETIATPPPLFPSSPTTNIGNGLSFILKTEQSHSLIRRQNKSNERSIRSILRSAA